MDNDVRLVDGEFTAVKPVDVELRLQPRRDDGWPMELRVLGGEEYPPALLPGHLLDAADEAPDDLAAALLAALLHDTVMAMNWTALRIKYPARRLLIRIDAAAAELHALPWEALHDGALDAAARPLATMPATPVARYVAGSWSRPAVLPHGPMRVLVVAPQPRDLATYDLAPLPAHATINAFRRATRLPGLDVRVAPPACSLDALSDWPADGIHALHIVTHTLRGPDGARLLMLTGADGRAQFVTAADVAAALQPHRAGDGSGALRLVSLAACDAAADFGLPLAQAGMPAVLAAQGALPHAQAVDAFVRFYTRLAAHGMVDRAANDMRAMLWLAHVTALPVLFSRLAAGRLMHVRATGHAPHPSVAQHWPCSCREESVNRPICEI